MTPYKNRQDMAPSTEVRRYLSVWAVVRMLQARQLRLTLVDTLRKLFDQFEGSVPEQMIDDQVVVFSGRNMAMMEQVALHYPGMEVPRRPYHDPWEAVKQRRLAMTRSTHVSCWTAGEESEGMWRLYCEDGGVRGRGVALQTTLGALEASVAPHDLVVSPIRYRHYHKAADRAVLNDELDAFMHKRMGFQHEREMRLLRFDPAHYHKLLPDWQTGELPNPAPAALQEYTYLDWNPGDVIQRITISPYADADYESVAREAIKWADPSLGERIEQSILDPRRYAPQF
jgi:hypothetical protein